MVRRGNREAAAEASSEAVMSPAPTLLPRRLEELGPLARRTVAVRETRRPRLCRASLRRRRGWTRAHTGSWEGAAGWTWILGRRAMGPIPKEEFRRPSAGAVGADLPPGRRWRFPRSHLVDAVVDR